MNALQIQSLSIAELAPRIKSRAVSPVELTRLFLQRIERANPILNAYVTVTADEALAAARRAGMSWLKAVIADRFTAFRFPSKTTSRPKACAPPPVRKFSMAGSRLSMRRW
jgi:Amidase